mgnify:FL=1
MLTELVAHNKVVGVKQLKKALRDGAAQKVFVAEDADPKLTDPICESCRGAAVPVEMVPTMAELGKACGIEVGAAVAALLRA